ncbi:hypothetical protein COCMIDRAFT_538 [Bipolaris oryzae ATCC 44560]|uniref:Uncharacterized protein n=1 Tax=Bipolaris oryzae ATCC 44560 TaxID=930090 RepID=W6ZLP7_COCMI|nr:uncharacterized protein COCMIDRAFT_538 [Bipolaris oryzae ATCC 44560]EUC50995.1 hypothetical protein COCMIDRAFT_538 [Bipolaris oryzae ATCC 44560]
MLSAPTPEPHAPDITAAYSATAPDSPGQDALPASDAQDSSLQIWRKAPTRHYTTLQEHADQTLGTETSGQDGGAASRHDARREGFSWGQQPHTGRHRHSQHAMTTEPDRPRSPPSFEEIMRRTHIDDANVIQNNKLRHVNSMESAGPTTIGLVESFSSNESDYNAQDHRRSSIMAFAKGMARHVPDFRILYPLQHKEDEQRRDSSEDAIPKLQKKDTSLFFAHQPSINSNSGNEKFSNLTVVIDEQSRGVEKPTKPANTQPAANSGLRARRKVDLDLSMPKIVPDLPARSRYPVDMPGNLAAPRPRSPKTPWIRNEQPRWESDRRAKSSPIEEEDDMGDNITTLNNDNHRGKGLLPGNDILDSLQPPTHERPPAKVRHRHCISLPLPKRSRSGTNTSDLDVVQAPGEGLALADERIQARTTTDLQQVAQDSMKSRMRRWRERYMTSSEDTAPASATEASKRRLSMNPFKRSSRLSDQAALELSDEKTTSTDPTSHNKERQYSSPSLAHIPVPPAFIPPGLSRVPTPPLYDANGEVKGKLADFLFDFQSGSAKGTRKKPLSGSEGYWDSDALLMSLSTGITKKEDDEDDEGPEGPLRNALRSRSIFDRTTNHNHHRTHSTHGFLGVKPPLSPSLAANSPMLGHDGWYRINHEDDADLRDSYTVAALARQEEEERRKFEWLVPEHLPNSPLCPLHDKYVGPSQGLCYWHGRRSGAEIREGEYARPESWSRGSAAEGDYMGAGGGSAVGDGMKLSPGLPTPVAKETKRRRLVSLSSP